jgi:molybdenum cofactor cytidylyltransferase
MPKTSSVSIPAILLGGREVRHLRVPKQILPFGDVTVLGRTLRAYLDAGISDVILVLGYKADLIASELGALPPNVRIVKNPLFDEGMGTFLRLGVREIPPGSQGFCIGLGDQPLLTPDLIRELQTAFIEGKKKILVPVHQSSLGLPAFFEPSIAEEILALPPQGELWDILKRHGDDLIDHATGFTSVIRSIEDQDDYHAMLRIAGLPIPDPVPAAAPDDSATPPPEETPAV